MGKTLAEVYGNWTELDVLIRNQKVAGREPEKTTTTGPGQDLESDLHDSILEYCRGRGWLAIHSRMDKKTTTALGVSDFIIVTHNTVLFVEAKRKGNKPTPKQRGFLMAIEVLGWPQAVVYSMGEFLAFLREQEPAREQPERVTTH